MQEVYLSSIRQQFSYYKSLGEKTIAQLEEKDLFYKQNETSNSISIIVNHLWGNMLSRWTDFLTSDGEKEWRNRDLEFENVIQDKPTLLSKWEEGWNCLFNALDSINKDNFNTEIFIRNQSHSVMDAINRQLAHYSYHIGQIVYIGVMIKGDQWKSLTIPKGESKSFNREKFSRGKHNGHFSEDSK